MIGSLSGKIIEMAPPFILVDVQGVGYEVEVPNSTLYRLPPLGSSIFLYTHFVVREDAQLLYGFDNHAERALFRQVIKISGVGPKLGLAILSGMDLDSFMRCVSSQDTASLTRIPGVGKKTAERLIIEMRDKLAGLGDTLTMGAEHAVGSVINDAVSALMALGYKPEQARRAVTKAPAELSTSEALIRFALQNV